MVWIVEFRVDCKEWKKDCRILFFDFGWVGFGFGLVVVFVGFFFLFYVGGLVFVNVKFIIEILFIVEKIVIEWIIICVILYMINKD